MEINELMKQIVENAHKHGWFIEWTRTNDTGIMTVGDGIALMHSELSEALEAYRDNDHSHFGEELADLFIRLLHYAGDLKVDLETEVLNKMEINKNRPYKHGRKNL